MNIVSRIRSILLSREKDNNNVIVQLIDKLCVYSVRILRGFHPCLGHPSTWTKKNGSMY